MKTEYKMILPKGLIEEIEKTGVSEARFTEILDKVAELASNQVIENAPLMAILPIMAKEFPDETERALAFMSLGMIVSIMIK